MKLNMIQQQIQDLFEIMKKYFWKIYKHNKMDRKLTRWGCKYRVSI